MVTSRAFMETETLLVQLTEAVLVPDCPSPATPGTSAPARLPSARCQSAVTAAPAPVVPASEVLAVKS